MTIGELIKRLEKFGTDCEIEIPHTRWNGYEDSTWLDEPVIIGTEEGNVVLCTESDVNIIKRLRGGMTEAEFEAEPKKTFVQIAKDLGMWKD